MNIGIDIDGVILDFEKNVRVHAELHDLLELKKDGMKNKDAFTVQDRYDWTEKEQKDYINKYFVELSKESYLLPGVKRVINYLKEDGHKLIIITARGGFFEEMKTIAEDIFKKEGLSFDKYYWKIKDKVEICKKENIDIMIDDMPTTCEKMRENKIKTLYFRDKSTPMLTECNYLTDVSNWGEIYRYIKNLDVK